MNDSKRISLIESTAENLTRISLQMVSLVASIRNTAAGQPGAQSYDAVRSGPRTVLFCEHHERDLDDCRRLYEEGDLEDRCSGIPVSLPSDPTGEAAVVKDRARSDERALDALVEKLFHATESLLDLAARYQPRTPTPKDQRESSQNDLGCESCRRINGPRSAHWWNPPHTGKPSDVGGVLERKMLLCTSCYQFVQNRGRIPNHEELAHKREYDKWPKRHEGKVA